MQEDTLVKQVASAVQSAKYDKYLQAQLSQHTDSGQLIEEAEKCYRKTLKLIKCYEGVREQAALAMRSLKETRDHIRPRYMRHLANARAAFQHDETAVAELGLKENRQQELDAWIEQTQAFYNNSVPYVRDLQSGGTALHELDEIKILVGQMAALSRLHKDAQDNLQSLAQQKEEALALLENWYSQLQELMGEALPSPT